jgi:hypothetical protein
MRCEIR